MIVEWDDPRLRGTWEKYRKMFPDNNWGYEGCGLSSGEIVALLNRSIETGRDLLTESFPDWPDDVLYGA